MLKRYLPYIVLALIVVSCSKDKYQTKPTISIKSVNGSEFVSAQDILVNIEYTDKEGDLGNGLLTYYRNRLNVTWPPNNDLADTAFYNIPDFPKATKGEFQLRIQAGFLNENPDNNDTVEFKIFVRDAGGNVSDTITTPVFVQVEQ